MTFPSNSESVAQDRLRTFFDRIERLHEERSAIGDDIKEVFAEAKAEGWDAKVMKIVLQKRRMDHSERLEQEALVDLYMQALGMVPEDGTPVATRAPAQQTAGHTADQGGESEAPDPALSADPIGDEGSQPSEPVGEVEPEGGGAEATAPGHGDPARIAHAQSTVALSNVVTLRSSSGLERQPGCLRPDSCAGSWRARCRDCELAFAAMGASIPHHGEVA